MNILPRLLRKNILFDTKILMMKNVLLIFLLLQPYLPKGFKLQSKKP